MLKRFDVEMNGDDLIIGEAPDGDWVRFADVSADLAELTRWRAMASSPEICARALDRLRTDFANCADVGRRLEARNRQLGDTIGRGELRIAQLELELETRLATATAALDAWDASLPRYAREALRAALTGQPAVPRYRCGSCRDTGKWTNGIDCPACGGASVQPAAPSEPYPLGHGARHFPELYAQPAAPARTEAVDLLKADDGEPATESCFIHGAFVPTQEGACPKCWRGEP